MIARPRSRRRPNRFRLLLVLGMLGAIASGCNRANDAASFDGQSSVQPRSPNKATRAAERARLALRSQPRRGLKPARDESAPGSAFCAAAQSPFAPDDVEVDDGNQDLSAERLALLLPGRPLVIELRMTIDGRPFRAVDDEMIDKLLAAADRNQDARPTWGEIFADPKRILGMRAVFQLDLSDRKAFMAANDANRNGRVDRDEARRFVARLKRSAAFLLHASPEFRQANLRQSILRTLLDANDDGALDEGELALAAQRLLIVDVNDDHIVDWSELEDSLAGDEQAMTVQTQHHTNTDLAAIALRAASDQPPGQNGVDGALTRDEFRRMEQAAPQLIVSADFGNSDHSSSGLSLVRASPELEPLEMHLSPSKLDLTLQFAGCRLHIAIDDRLRLEAAAPSATPTAEAMESSPSAKEPPPSQLAAIQAVACNEQDVLFSLLDVNRDRRLTPRELRQAKTAFGRIDSDDDGRLASEEIPVALALWLGRGPSPETSPRRFSAPAKADVARAVPAWFIYMDSNRDQEVSAQEFPGSTEKFRSLDLNGDGFIVDTEARAADSAIGR